MSYRRVLIGTDLSDQATAAAQLARSFGDGQTAFRVAHVAHNIDAPSRTDRDDASNRAELAEWCAKSGMSEAEQVILHGSPAREIVKDATAFRADLIVVGHAGRSLLERVLLGSTARNVVRLATCDTLVGRGDAPIRKILVATDFFEPSARAARRARQFASERGASLLVVHAIDPDMWRQAAQKTPRDGPEGEAWLNETYASMLTKFNNEHLGGLAKELLARGRPARVVADEAQKEGVDLVVAGTHGAHGIERILLGAQAEAMIEQAHCSVLVVRSAE